MAVQYAGWEQIALRDPEETGTLQKMLLGWRNEGRVLGKHVKQMENSRIVQSVFCWNVF
jgi:hypothetical protein